MIEVLITTLLLFSTVLIAEFCIAMGKIIYDDFFKKDEIGFVKIDAEDWEYLKEQTRKWNDNDDAD